MNSSRPAGAIIGPALFRDFMVSLRRLFKIGVYYPAAHPIFTETTDRLIRQIAALAGEKPAITLENYHNSVRIDEAVLDHDLPFVAEIKEIMASLDVHAFTVSRDISCTELHDFVHILLAQRSRIMSAKSFSQVEITNLPASIEVHRKKFVARKVGSIDDPSSTSIDTLVESLAEYGLSAEQLDTCKTLLASLPRFLSSSGAIEDTDAAVSWHDVSRLLASAVKSNRDLATLADTKPGATSIIDALGAMLEQLEHHPTHSKARTSLNLIVSLIKESAHLKKHHDEANPISSDHYLSQHLVAEKIQAFTAKNRLHRKNLAAIADSSPDDEILSILLQLAQHEQPLQAQLNMQKFFREILSSPISEKRWAILVSGLHSIITTSQAAPAGALPHMVLEPLRRSRHASTTTLFKDIVRLCEKENYRLIWPYVVNEILLVGRGADKESYEALCRFAAQRPAPEIKKGMEALGRMEAFQNKMVAEDIFLTLPVESYRLFLILLHTDLAPLISTRIIEGLTHNPPDWLTKAMAPALDGDRQAHREFLRKYLHAAHQGQIPDDLLKQSADLLVEALRELPPERRTDPWVTESINAFASLKTKESLSFMKEIATAKKLLLLPQWPAPCRKAAALVLSAKRKR
jgi:hypothetical protein